MAEFQTIYENTTANAERVGWNNTPGAHIGNRLARWVVHNHQTGLFHFTEEKPELDTRIDFEYAKAVCKMGQGAECCRYLTMGAQSWSCQKFAYHHLTLDRRVWRTQMGIAGEESINAQGDNCAGRAD